MPDNGALGLKLNFGTEDIGFDYATWFPRLRRLEVKMEEGTSGRVKLSEGKLYESCLKFLTENFMSKNGVCPTLRFLDIPIPRRDGDIVWNEFCGKCGLARFKRGGILGL